MLDLFWHLSSFNLTWSYSITVFNPYDNTEFLGISNSFAVFSFPISMYIFRWNNCCSDFTVASQYVLVLNLPSLINMDKDTFRPFCFKSTAFVSLNQHKDQLNRDGLSRYNEDRGDFITSFGNYYARYSVWSDIDVFCCDFLFDIRDEEGGLSGYVVLHRPWAFVQWLDLPTIEEEYVLMAEPDHIFVNPLTNLAQGDYPAACPFFYIRILESEKIIRKYYPVHKGPGTNIDPIENSPAIMKKGCDGSVLLDDTITLKGEKTTANNKDGLKGFRIIDRIKNRVEPECPGIVTFADILTVAARDAVILVGGPHWEVPLGRKDCKTAGYQLSNTNLPTSDDGLLNIISKFLYQGLSVIDMVALSETGN